MPKKIRPIRIEGNTAYITLTKGYTAVIDATDVHLASGNNWNAAVTKKADGSVRSVYAASSRSLSEGGRKTVLLHRVIAQTPDGLETDHIDGDGLNNRRANLRNSTVAQNRRNRRTGCNNTSGVKGVSWNKAMGQWKVDIHVGGKKHYLGCFDTIDAASNAYASASAELHGEFGRAHRVT